MIDSKEGLKHVEQYNREFYANCGREEVSKITKKHSFRSFVNQDRSPSSGTNIYDKARRKQNASPVQNSSGLKYSLQEYASNVDEEKRGSFKLRQKPQPRKDVVTGNVTVDSKPGKLSIEPQSKSMQTYYDMLVTQKKPFNLRKGSLVTPERI